MDRCWTPRSTTCEIEVQVWEVTVVTAEGLHRKVTVDMTNGSILGDEVDD